MTSWSSLFRKMKETAERVGKKKAIKSLVEAGQPIADMPLHQVKGFWDKITSSSNESEKEGAFDSCIASMSDEYDDETAAAVCGALASRVGYNPKAKSH